MKTIQITAATATLISTVTAASGKAPWLLIADNCVVAVCAGRNEARAIKTEGSTVVKATDVELVKYETDGMKVRADVAKAINKEQQAAIEAEKTNPMNCAVCPKCGSTEIFHGQGNKSGTVVNEDCVCGCHNCDWFYDGSIRNKSEVESPCWLVWDTADKMKGSRRKDVIAACVEKGVAFYTARTQYQLWLTANRNAGNK